MTLTKQITFDVYLPATVHTPSKFAETIEVEVYENFGEEFLTAESSELIERTRAHHMGYLHGEDIRDLRKRLNLTHDSGKNEERSRDDEPTNEETE